MPSQPRASTADALDRLTPGWDDLCRRARLTRTARDIDELDEAGQLFLARAAVALRGSNARWPSATPLKITETGAWF